MGLDQLGVLTVGTLVCKEGEHTLLVIPPWSLEYLATVHRWLRKVITSGQVPWHTWSTRQTLAGWLQT